MSDADLIRRLYELSAAGRIEETAELIDEDIEWDTTEAPTGVRARGRDAAMADLRGMLEAWEEYESEVESVTGRGDSVVVVVRNRGVGRTGNVPIEARRAHVWRLRDGRPVSFRLRLDPDRAR